MGRIPFRAHGPPSGHGHECHTNGRDDHAGDDRWEEPNDLREEGGQDEAERGGNQYRTEDHAEIFLAGRSLQDGQHGGHARERDPLHQRQLRAQEGNANALQDGGQAADE